MKLNFNAPINQLSYGYCGFNLLKELLALNIDVAFFPISSIELDNSIYTNEIYDAYNKALLYGGYKDVPCIKLWHQFQLDMFPHCSKRIGWPIFELDEFSAQEKNHLNNCDEIIVCSKWAKNIVLKECKHLNETIHVVPLGVDTNIFYPADHRNHDKCVFLNIGKIEIRKLHDILPIIFAEAFKPTDPVELWLLCENVFLSDVDQKQWYDLFKNSPMGEKIRFISRLRHHNDVSKLINEADFLIQLSRAEGWNLPALEGLACGKYILAVDYSGSTEFLSTDNAFLVSIDSMESAFDGRFFINNIGSWASFSDEQIHQSIVFLRKMFEMWQHKQTFNKKGVITAHNFTWKNSVKQLLKITGTAC